MSERTRPLSRIGVGTPAVAEASVLAPMLPFDALPEPPATVAASIWAAFTRKHTFDCAQPTRGGVCNC